MSALLTDFTLGLATTSAPVVQEFALISGTSVQASPVPHTRIQLQAPLANCYDRTITTVNANVGPATAGSTVTEVMGSGSASTPDQEFALRQTPLTYIQAPTPTGRQSTLVVRASGVEWTAVASLYQQPGNGRVYSTLDLPGGSTDVQFGDGVEGAMLPTGTEQPPGHLPGRVRIGRQCRRRSDHNACRPSGRSQWGHQPAGGYRRTGPAVSPLTSGLTRRCRCSLSAAPSRSPTTRTSPRASPGSRRPRPPGSPAARAAASCSLSPPRAVLRFRREIPPWPTSSPPCKPTATERRHLRAVVPRNHLPAHCRDRLRPRLPADRSAGRDPADAQADLQLRCPDLRAGRVRRRGRCAHPGRGRRSRRQRDHAADRRHQHGRGHRIGCVLVSSYNAWLAAALTQPLPRPCSGSATSICPYLPVATPGVLPLPAEILVLDPDPKKTLLRVMTI